MKIRQTLAAASILLAIPARSQVLETFSFSPNLAIPDGNAAGISDTQTIATTITQIGELRVSLDISGEYNGDLYLFLRHDSGFSVLLNRTGRDSGNAFGYGDSGFDITLRDDAANNVHTYRNQGTPSAGVKLSGNWQPDGRNVDPSLVASSDTPSTPLSSFQGLNPNGQWTLFAADLVNGGASHLNSWSVTVTPVPEPKTIALVSGVALVAFGFFRRLRG
jgi:subtilisin-like proprotein convertase family protein